MAQRYCQSQNASLPSVQELEVGETSGIYHGGIELKKDALYHLHSGMYYSSEAQLDNRVRPNLNPQGSTGYYYCIRQKKAAARESAKALTKRPVKTVVKSQADRG